MEKISEAFKDLTPNNAAENKAQGSRQNGRKYDLYAFSCPSIIYHNGISGCSRTRPTAAKTIRCALWCRIQRILSIGRTSGRSK